MYSPCFLSWQKILPISFQMKTFLPVRNEKQQQMNNDVVSGAQTTLMHLYKAVNPHTQHYIKLYVQDLTCPQFDFL